MEFRCSTEEFLNAVKEGNKRKALDVTAETLKEIERLENTSSVNKTGKTALRSLRQIIYNVEKGGDLQKVQELRREAHGQFNNHLQFYLKQIKEVEMLPDYKSEEKPWKNKVARQNDDNHGQKSEIQSSVHRIEPSHDSREMPNNELLTENETSIVKRSPHTSAEDSQSCYKSHTSTEERSNSEKTHENDSDIKIRKSKRASQAMRQNNPDIADLSDTNRPTKIAERFSELYDNEWTEAFEELGKNNMTEEKAIEYLWTLVEEAYKLCSETSEAQVKEIAKVFERIIVLGPDNYADKTLHTDVQLREDPEDKHLLIQYRKEIASDSLPRIVKDFLEYTKSKRRERRRALPPTMPAVDQFSKKVIEVVWWMCVQDPPVYMCLSQDYETFDQTLYKAYTKSGTIPAFFVWPALRLYEKGGVLMKGVVQYK